MQKLSKADMEKIGWRPRDREGLVDLAGTPLPAYVVAACDAVACDVDASPGFVDGEYVLWAKVDGSQMIFDPKRVIGFPFDNI